MNIQLQRVNKRNDDLSIPVHFGSLDVSVDVRGGISLTAPTFILTVNTEIDSDLELYEYNYVFVEKWGRYYFIDDFEIDGNIRYIFCSEDVLASWYAQITQQTFFCTRSAYKYNESLCDSMFPTETNYYYNYVSFADLPWTDISDGTFLLAITAGDSSVPHFGSNTYYTLTYSELSDFMDALLSTENLGISGLADNIVKSMINPLQYIRSCYFFPFKFRGDVSVQNIPFSWWHSSASGRALDISSFSDSRMRLWYEFPAASFNDANFWTNFNNDGVAVETHEYQYYPPYSQYILTVWPFGQIELPANVITTMRSPSFGLYFSIDIDYITGMGELIIWNNNARATALLSTTCQIGVEIPVGEILQNFVGAAASVGAGVGSIANGNVLGAASSVVSGIESLVPACATQGEADGIAQLQINHHITLTRYYQPCTLDGDLVGFPLCQNVRVGDLNGFAKFENVDLRGTMLAAEKSQIESLLTRGVFVG